MTVPYFTDGAVTLHTGDALDVLRELPGEGADCVVTSPPYWGLRDYGTGRWAGGDATCAHPRRGSSTACAGRGGGVRGCQRCGAVREDRQYGIEATPEQYVDHLRAVFTELRRVLVARGTVWLNLGDSYSATPPGRTAEPMRASTLTNRAAVGRLRESVQRAGVDRTRALVRKNMVGMPWRVTDGSETRDRSLAVPERITLSVPRRDRGVSWEPYRPADPLAAYGQQLHIDYGVNVGGHFEWVRRGSFLVTESEAYEDSVQVTCEGLLSLIAEARLAAPFQPSGTLVSTVQALVEPALTVSVDAGLTNRSVPVGLEWDDDRMGALQARSAGRGRYGGRSRPA